MATGGAIKAGEAFIELTLKGARGFGDKLKGAMRSMARLAASAAKVGVAMGAAFGGAALAGLTKAVRHFVTIGDKMDKMSQRTGVSVEALSQLAFAAEQSGTNIDQLSQAIFRANRRIGNAATGTGPAVRALSELNLEAAKLAEIAPEDQFEVLVRALNKVENPARRSQLAFEVFGDNWRQIAPLINQGADGIAKLRVEADLLGRTVTGEQAARAAELADSWNEVKSAISGVMMELANALAPTLVRASDMLRDFLLDWKIWLKQLEVWFLKTMSWLGEAYEGFLNTIGDTLSAMGFEDFEGMGTVNRDIQNNALRRAQLELAAMRRGGSPSERLRQAQEEQAPAIVDAVSEGVQRAMEKSSSGVGGRSFGSFFNDPRQFGTTSVGRQQMMSLKRIEEHLARQLEILEQTGFLAFI